MTKLISKTIFICTIVYASAVAAATVPALKVYAADVSAQEIFDEVEALGTLKANEHVSLAATVTELVTAVYFDDNQRVKKGDLLLEMDTREEVAELAEEEATLSEARRQLKRLVPLAAKGAASKTTLDESRAEVERAKARIAAIKARINLRRITAPFDGIVGLRNISVGALAKSDTTITTIDDDSLMKLDFTVPSLYLRSLKPGLKIEASSKAFGGEKFEGEITGIDSRIDPTTRAITVRARIKNPERILKPGLLMHVSLQTQKRTALVIPEECLIPVGDEYFVLLVVKKDDLMTVKRQKIEIGSRKKGEVEVVSGLQKGERIISEGLMKAKPGKPIEVIAAEQKDIP